MSPAESTPQTKSTGPRTPEGKAIASMNAMRHGLTGRVVVLPTEDMNVYRAFCKELMADLAPETPLERQYAQTFCDTQWRLNRARSYEDSMLALGHFEHAASSVSNIPEIARRPDRRQSLPRKLQSLRQPQPLRTASAARAEGSPAPARRTPDQTPRGKKQELQSEAARNLPRNESPTRRTHSDNAPGQFVFSTAEIERELSRPGPAPRRRRPTNPRSNKPPERST